DPLPQRLAAHYLACVEAEDRRSLQLRLEDQGRRFIAPWSGNESFQHQGLDSVFCRPAGDAERAFLTKGTADARGADTGFYGYPLWFDGKDRLSPLFILPVLVEDLGGRGPERSYLLHRSDRVILNRYLFGAFSGEELDEIQRELENEDFPSFTARLSAAMEHARSPRFDVAERAIEPLPTDGGPRWIRTPVFLRDARGPYTYNLRQDLAAMARYASVYGEAGGTALGLLWEKAAVATDKTDEAPAVTELIPLNPSQETAAGASLRHPLTVITGPPGTGKSQVVVDLLAASILSGQPILFASKNNQAVDVVRQRLREALGEEMDFSLRVGNREAMDAMAPEIQERLGRLMEAGPPNDGKKARQRLARIQKKIATHDARPPTPKTAATREAKRRALKDELADATRQLCRVVWAERLYRNAATVRRALKDYREALREVGGRGSAFIQSLDRLAAAQRTLAGFFPIWITTALSVRNAVPLRAAQFDHVVIDEASQCDIASAAPLLYRAKRATIIGDPHQFRHIAGIDETVEAALATSEGLLPEWSYVTHSLFDVAARAFERAGRREPLFLEEHYRSHPDIISFSNTQFYGGRLTIRTDLEAMGRRLPGVEPGVFWLDIRGNVPPSTRSAYNLDEIDAVMGYVGMLMTTAGADVSIGIVTPFRAQTDRLKSKVRDAPWYDVADRRLRVGTSHTFQGDECDIVVFSPVVADGIRAGARDWAATTESLLNVAVTRARAALHIVGDRAACEEAGGALAALARHARHLDMNKKVD
ncbi:MAG: DEAD/DEAH box helicase, partial [Rhodothermales bacterium]|nr:DEAD/DEAH box helicase [Rhodothermales bacterium]